MFLERHVKGIFQLWAVFQAAWVSLVRILKIVALSTGSLSSCCEMIILRNKSRDVKSLYGNIHERS